MSKTIVALRVALNTKLYRDIEISGDASLYKLAEVINNVFGFDFDHAFGFYDNKKNPYKSKEFYELFKDMGEGSSPGSQSVKKTKWPTPSIVTARVWSSCSTMATSGCLR